MSTSTVLIALALTLAAGPAHGAPAAKAAPVQKSAPAPKGAPNLKLKPGADGRVCIECHAEFQKVLRQAVIHAPVRSRECVSCHNPHASQRAKFLSDEPNLICAGCHGDMTPAASRSVHKPAAEKKCLSCHDPHASATKAVLVKPPLELCGTCHKPLVERAAKARYKHAPLQSTGCGACHEAHASAKADHVLKNGVPGLCTGCHKTDKPIFAKQHLDYKVAGASCTSCHDPHGSNQRGMLYDRVHAPVARGMCGQCHQPPTSATPFATKAAGTELCRGCHGPMVAKALDKNRVHVPLVGGKGCLSCHNPHASKEAKLLAQPMKSLCGSCHADTIQRDVRAASHHPPVRDGECTACHDPHSGEAPLMFVNGDGVALCQTCHDWSQHSTHPLGDKVVDPRNPNLTLECLSCHRSHGTEYKRLMPAAKTSDVCTACHAQFRR